jgi:hypothetical protein
MVMLKHGLVVSLDTLKLAWSLEDKGCSIVVAPDGVGLLVRPKRLLTPDDTAAIRAHQHELLQLTRYCEAVQ